MSKKPIPFPKGCVIKNIKFGKLSKANFIYAELYGSDGELLISATLEYITKRIESAGIEE